MNTFPHLSLIAIMLIIAGGIAFLATWDPKSPSSPVEKILSDDRFPR